MAYEPEETSVFAGVEKSIAWLDRLALTSMIFMLTIAISKFTKQSEVSLFDITFPIWSSYLGLIVITIAHIFVMRHIINSCADAWLHLSVDRRNALFDHIVRTGGLMTKGANKYRDAITESRYSLQLKTNVDDPPTWIHHVLIILTMLTLIEFEWSFLAFLQFFFAIVIIITNWTIGASSLLCLGDLGSQNDKSRFFIDGTARPRQIGHASGFFIGDNVDYRIFLLAGVVEAFIGAMMLLIALIIPFLIIFSAAWLLGFFGWNS